eukprot:COSAG01_NODE_582_length_15201_cov_7.218315_19_plen_169_part_00
MLNAPQTPPAHTYTESPPRATDAEEPAADDAQQQQSGAVAVTVPSSFEAVTRLRLVKIEGEAELAKKREKQRATAAAAEAKQARHVSLWKKGAEANGSRNNGEEGARRVLDIDGQVIDQEHWWRYFKKAPKSSAATAGDGQGGGQGGGQAATQVAPHASPPHAARPEW